MVLSGAGPTQLRWQPPVDPGGSTLILYDVLRSATPGDFTGALCLATGITSTTYAESGFPGGGYYLIRSRDACGGDLGTVTGGAPRSGPVCGHSDALVGAWSFDEGVGTTSADLSGYENLATLQGVAWTTTGKYGSALVFNGTNARVSVPDAASLHLTTGMTLEAWVNPATVTAAWRDVIYKGNDNFYLEGTSDSGGRPAGGGTFAGSPLYGTSALATNTWSHLATTYDGATLKLYVNGVQVASRAQAGPIATSTNPLEIGGDLLNGQYFNGTIDEVRVYNRALTVGEVQADMNAPIGAAPPDTTPPTVSITSPSASSTVSHVTTISATASDDVAVASVEFFVDGVSLGTDARAPYVIGWNTTLAANGVHTLTAIARDGVGNQTTSASVVVSTLNPAFVNEVVVPDITAATTIAFLPDGRMLVGELTETIWVVQPGASQASPTPFLQLDGSQLQGEQGLMDILPDSNFAQNGYYYVFYTRGAPASNNHNRVSRFTASGNGTVAGSELVLWQDDVVAAAEHHGGSLAFGADGKLYISSGDQFVAASAQQLDNYHGKILCINLDGSIPTDNPFFDGAGSNKDEIWVLGLRNPFRMSIDPISGKMYIGDVGGNDPSTATEEVNVGVRGANYGWPMCEGNCASPGTTNPIVFYPHSGRDASITGGVVYRGTQFPSEYYGSYFFADYVQNWIKRVTFDANGNVAAVVNFWPADGSSDGPLVGDPVKFVQGPDGSLYYVDIGFNDQHVPNPAAIRRIRYSINNQPPIAVASADRSTGLPPLLVTFSSAGSSDPDGATLSYSWTFGDGGSSILANPAHTYLAAGPYVVQLSVSDGFSTTLANILTIKVGNPPQPTILTPADGSFFVAGDTINFSGIGTDQDDGNLPASAFVWTILFHHDSHVHPDGTVSNSKTGTLDIPSSGHDFQGSTNYEIVLTVTDSSGLTGSTSVTVYPDKVNIAFDTVPSGLTIELDGISKLTPFTLGDVKGFQHTINAPAQSSGGTSYGWVSWSDGGAQSHGIVIPTVNASFVATFQAAPPPTGLVAAYSFNETTGTTVMDASGTGNTGSIVNATRTTSGKYGGALVFNGTTALVTVNDSASLRLTTAMTLEAWVNPSTVSGAWRDMIYVSNYNTNSLNVFERTANGDVSPVRVIRTGLNQPHTVERDLLLQELFVANNLPSTQNPAINVYDMTASYPGNDLPKRTITGTLTQLNRPAGITVDSVNRELYVANDVPANSFITVYPLGANGNVAPLRVLQGPATGLDGPIGISVDLVNNEILVSSYRAADAGSIAVFPRTASGNVAPIRLIQGPNTGFNRPQRLALDLANDEIIVANSAFDTASPGNLLVFNRLASGNVSPKRQVAGPNTALCNPVGLVLDAVNDTIVVSNSQVGTSGCSVSVATYARTASGDAAPISKIGPGPLSLLSDSEGVTVTTTVDCSDRSIADGTACDDGNPCTQSETCQLHVCTGGTPVPCVAAMVADEGKLPTIPVAPSSSWSDVIYKGNDNYYLEGTSAPSGVPAMGGTFSTGGPIYGTSGLAANTWSHLVATYDGATVRLYVNGVQVASRAQTGAIQTSANPLQIGGDTLFGQYFNGLIDEVRVYNVALTPAQIVADRDAPL